MVLVVDGKMPPELAGARTPREPGKVEGISTLGEGGAVRPRGVLPLSARVCLGCACARFGGERGRGVGRGRRGNEIEEEQECQGGACKEQLGCRAEYRHRRRTELLLGVGDAQQSVVMVSRKVKRKKKGLSAWHALFLTPDFWQAVSKVLQLGI